MLLEGLYVGVRKVVHALMKSRRVTSCPRFFLIFSLCIIHGSSIVGRPSSFINHPTSCPSSAVGPIPYILTPSTQSLPPLSSSLVQPTTNVTLRYANRLSMYLNNSPLLRDSSSAVRPSSCSHAVCVHSSFPDPMHPVSSIRVPTMRGLRRRGILLLQVLQIWDVRLENRGMPQLFGRDQRVAREEPERIVRPLGAEEHIPHM